MKRLLLAPLLISLLVGCSSKDKYTIYTTERPPSSWSGIIDSEGYFYWFTNSAVSASADGCDIRSNGCWIKTNVKAEIINKDIIKVYRYGTERYYCSEEHIQARNKANPDFSIRNGIDFGYGKCTKDGWVRNFKY